MIGVNSKIEEQKIEFPVRFNLKVIMDNSIDQEVNKKNIKSILLKNRVQYGDFTHKLSGGDKYISFSIGVKIEDEKQMDELYKGLKELPGIKYAI